MLWTILVVALIVLVVLAIAAPGVSALVHE